MKRAPDWTKEEFDILVRNYSLSSGSLTARLPGRTLDAIEIVRNGLHEFHQKRDSGLLSKMMKDQLSKSGSVFICPVCGERIRAVTG